MPITLRVNGREVEATIPGHTTLLAFLRDELGLTGSKNGCGQGHCGACTVIVDGRAQRACLVRMSRLDGRRVETIEGLADGDRLHPLQWAFIREGAVQCGFCTPGMIVAAKALLDANPRPTDDEIKQALRHNLCRCTGYVKIIRAVHSAAEMLRRGVMAVPVADLWDGQGPAVGHDVPRLDAVGKVTGQLRYGADLTMDGVLHGRVLRSPHPHAEVLAVDVSRARRMEGVVAVLTAADVPGRNRFGLIVADQPVLAEDRVRFVGDAVAVVYAETDESAARALEAIEVAYRPLPVVSTPQQALRPDAPPLHEGGNLLAHVAVRKGDVAQGFAQAEVIVEGTYHTPFVEHAYLEPEAGLAAPADDGGVTVWVGSQGPADDRRQVAAALALPEEKVRIAHVPMGGAFGGKEDITVQIFTALGALHTGRPVKMVFDRAESLRVSTKRHAQTLRYRTGATGDGRLTAVEAEIYLDTGAYASVGEAVAFRTATFSCGPYRVPHAKVDVYAAYTNNVPAGAMRGFGNPQATFAAESQMDRLADELGLDPLALRRLNALEEGDATITGHVLRESVGIGPCLAAVEEALRGEPRPTPGPGKRVGVGVAASYKNVGLGASLPDEAGARVELIAGGRFRVRVGCVDVGQGARTAMAQIAADALGVEVGRVAVHAGDTARDPLAGMTTASRQTFISGNAVLRASRDLREQLWSHVAEVCGVSGERLALRGGTFADGAGGPALLTLAELAAGQRPFVAEARYAAPHTQPKPDRAEAAAPDYRLHFAYCYAAQAAIVEVDEHSGEVRVLKIVAAHDVGRAINPQAVEGQIEGGVVMGLGYGLSEAFRLEEGQIVTDTLRKLGLPQATDAPVIVPILVEDPHPEGPYGAKGMGELPASATAPAITNAIFDAVGVRITALPASRERVAAALNGFKRRAAPPRSFGGKGDRAAQAPRLAARRAGLARGAAYAGRPSQTLTKL